MKLSVSGCLYLDLELLTPPIHEACTDDRSGQFQQRFVYVQPPFKADSQLAKACKPSMCALYNPAMLAQRFAALNTSPCNSAGNASSSEIGTAALVVVAFVRMQLRRSLACPPRLLIHQHN